ncbi:MAG: DUF1801 domain-containing protein [Propionibacteriaceae bacterium]|nr:DUF1801 domain-containing protein [Propionibacteriaceae bacterium]
MPENKTQPTTASVSDFLAGLPPRRREEAETLIELMRSISGLEPVLWGPSIIGFGSVHYRYDSGREGDMPLLGFSPRKARLTIYFSEGFDRYGEQLAMLGKHSSSVSCLYATKLADLDLDVLREMLVSSHRRYAGQNDKPATVAEYVERVPAASRPLFDEIRALVRAELPDAEEVLSYGLVGYRRGRRRAIVYVGGWNDHVSLYPAPENPELRAELEPLLRGAGTIWLPLTAEPPRALLRRIVQNLAEQG